MAGAIVLTYLVSALILIFGGTIQLFFKPRKAAIPAFIFAACDVLFIVYVVPDFITA